MKVKWLLQTDVFDENLDRLKSEITSQGMQYKEVEYLPYESNTKYIKAFKPNDCVIFYGSLNFAGQILRETSWIPGVFSTLKRYDCTQYYPLLHKYLLNSDFILLPFGCLQRQNFYHLIRDEHVFIRPTSGFKTFTGQVVNLEDKHWLNKLCAYGIDYSDLVLVSTPTNIKYEWRLVVSDRVISGSQYRKDGQINEDCNVPTEVIEFANQVLEETRFRPDPIFTLDICQVGDTLSVLECGGFSCAGLYKCDLKPIVTEVAKLSINQWKQLYDPS